MSIEKPASKDFPLEFQEELIDLIKRLIPCTAIRFSLINPKFDTKGFYSYNVNWKMEKLYREYYRHMDPMRPSRYENTDVRLVCSDTMLSREEWQDSVFFKEFMKPQHYDHNIDIFFRKSGKIIAVLALVRDDKMGPFREDEAELLRHLQPFMQYALNSVYLPRRFVEREDFGSRYRLTERELDVMEVIMAGADTRTMACELNLSVATIKTHLQHIFEKTRVRSTRELVCKLLQELNVD